MWVVSKLMPRDMAYLSSGHRMKLSVGVMSGHWGVGENDHVASSERWYRECSRGRQMLTPLCVVVLIDIVRNYAIKY